MTAATKLEKARMTTIAEGWCIPCLLNRNKRQPTVQHVTHSGRRLGHMFTYGSCPWHHQGIPVNKDNGNPMTNQEMTGMLGPSFAHSKREFQATFGNERDVLVRLQNWVLDNPNYLWHELHSQWVHLQDHN